MAENSVKYVPPDDFIDIQILQNFHFGLGSTRTQLGERRKLPQSP